MGELVQEQLGPEAKLDLKLEGGKLILSVVYEGKEAGASMGVSLEPGLFLDKLKGLIPGQIDDAVIELIKAALKNA